MAQPISLSKVFPIYKVEHDCILSKQGDVTLAYDATLPEIFTMSDQEYEGFHQILIKRPSRYCPPILFFINRIGSFPENAKQILTRPPEAFLTDEALAKSVAREEKSFLSRSSERFFNERPYLDHKCYGMLSCKPAGRKGSALKVGE